MYAYEQGGDLNAKQMLEYIGWLYGQEDCYRQSGLTAEEITRQRNSLRTKDVIGRMRSFLNVLTSEGHPPWGDLMEKAVNYLKNFWNQLFAYLKDGRYSIDNTIRSVSSVPWRVSGKTRCSLAATVWRMCRPPIIR